MGQQVPVSVCYTYRDSGDLATRVDARGYTVTLSYDELHRLTLKDYSNDGGVTPDVTYDYYRSGNGAAPDIHARIDFRSYPGDSSLSLIAM